jgi:hypothetical protein
MDYQLDTSPALREILWAAFQRSKKQAPLPDIEEL